MWEHSSFKQGACGLFNPDNLELRSMVDVTASHPNSLLGTS